LGFHLRNLFEMSKSSYNSVEASNIDFLQTCLHPIIQKIENEFFVKLFPKALWNNIELRFDSSELLRLDSATQADYFVKMHSIGALTTNEIRQKIDAANPVKGGNRAYVAVNLQPTDNLIAENEGDTKEKSNQIDNKLKQTK
jgi:HK97 family phage portal protein